MDDLSYAYKPFLFSRGERVFRLEPDALVGEWGGQSRRWSYADIASMRLCTIKQPFQPMMTSCVLRSRDGRKLMLRSLSAKGFGSFDDRMAGHRAFVTELLDRARRANPALRVTTGQSMGLWLLCVVGLALCLILVAGAAVMMTTAHVFSSHSIPAFIVLVIYLPSLWRIAAKGRPREINLTRVPVGSLPADLG